MNLPFISHIHAASSSIIGTVTLPAEFKYGSVNTGLSSFMNNALRLVFVIGGIYMFINLILAGFGYMSAGGDAKAITKAWERIYQSFIGLLIIVGSFAIAAVIGQLLFGDSTYLLKLQVFGP